MIGREKGKPRLELQTGTMKSDGQVYYYTS